MTIDDGSRSVAGTSGRPVTTAGTGASLIGRQRELDALVATLDSVADGSGQLFLLEGEPGIGKTHLARALGEQARARGFTVVWGRCWEEGGAPAYWPWTQVLRALLRQRGRDSLLEGDVMRLQRLAPIVAEVAAIVPDEASNGDAPPDQFALFDAVTTMVQDTVAERPTVLVLDDLHAADHDSLRLLQFLARDLPQNRLLVVGTFRADDATLSGADGLLGKLARDGRVLPLRGLTEAQVAALVERVAGEPAGADVVRSVHRATRGNPLYVDSITHLLVAEDRLHLDTDAAGDSDAVDLPLPPSIREATRSRLAYLDEESRGVLRVAAVIGRTFTMPVLGVVVGRPPDALLDLLDGAVNRGTIRPSATVAGSFVFEHILVRDALYRELEPSRRAELHWQVGVALEQVNAGDLDQFVAELAHHFLLAVGPGREAARAVDYSQRAGDRAMAQTAHDEAAAHYRRALDTLVAAGSGDPTRRCDLLLALGAARTRSGDTVDGRATHLEAAALARERGLGEQLAAAAIGYAGITGFHFSGRRDETLVALLEEAIAALRPGDSEMRVRLLARLSVALYWSDLDGRRFELSEEAVAMARRLRDPGTLALAIHSRRYAQWGPDNFEQRLADGARCRTLAFEANDLELAASASRWRITDLLEDGDVAAADRELDSYAELAQRLHQPFLLAYTAQFRALRAIMQGRFRDGEALAEDARQQAQRAGNPLADLVHGSQLLPVRWLCRRHEELDAYLGALRSSPPHPATTSVMAMIHAELGDRETAAALLEQLAAPGLRKLRRDMLFLPGLIRLTLVSAALQDATHAEDIYDQLRPFVGRVAVVGAPAQACWGAVDHYLGVLAALFGRHQWAAEHFEAALVIGARLGAPALLAQTRLEFGTMLLNTAGGDRDRGMALLSAAGRTAYALDLERMIQRLDAVVDADGTAAGTSEHRLGPSTAPTVGTSTCTLRRDGDFWTVMTPRGSTHVRDAKGMRHLATLLAQPGRPIHVLDLAGGHAGALGVPGADEVVDVEDAGVGFVAGFGDAGEVLDDTAKNAYRRRLGELDEAIAEAEEFNDIGRAAQLGTERDMLIEQLAQAVGLGGRDRRAVSVSERARVNVTRAIRSAIRKIGELDRDAGHYLDTTVVTGTYCVFDPQRSS
jgi:tetratricopeptide (TPR) repeat protein